MSSLYIGRLKTAIEHLHRCSADYIATAPVHEIFNGKTVWQGNVEIFKIDHPHAKRCFAWSYWEGAKEGEKNAGERFVTVLEIPPVVSPETAVRAQIGKDVKDSDSSD